MVYKVSCSNVKLIIFKGLIALIINNIDCSLGYKIHEFTSSMFFVPPQVIYLVFLINPHRYQVKIFNNPINVQYFFIPLE